MFYHGLGQALSLYYARTGHASAHMTQDTCGQQVLPSRFSLASGVSKKSANARRAILPRCALSPVWLSNWSI